MSELTIFAVGDFHGKFPKKLISLAKRKDVDLIVTPGDFAGDKELAKLFFKYVYGSGKPLSDFIGRKKANQLEKRNFDNGIKIIKELDKMNKPIVVVTGNWDYSKWFDMGVRASLMKEEKAYVRKLYSVLNSRKNLHVIDYSKKKLFGINFAGQPRSSFPGFVSEKRGKNLIKKYGKKGRIYVKRMNYDNKKYYSIMEKIVDRNTIFVPHNAPYNTKLDLLKKGPQKGKHYGSYLARRIILDKKPFLVICGHVHENHGKCTLGKSLIVNVGSAAEGKAALIKIDSEKKKVKSIKLIR